MCCVSLELPEVRPLMTLPCMLTARRKGCYDLYGEKGLKDGVPDGQGGALVLPLYAKFPMRIKVAYYIRHECMRARQLHRLAMAGKQTKILTHDWAHSLWWMERSHRNPSLKIDFSTWASDGLQVSSLASCTTLIQSCPRSRSSLASLARRTLTRPWMVSGLPV